MASVIRQFVENRVMEYDANDQMKASTCDGKQAFDTPRLAMTAARQVGTEHYRCEYCGKWHVGTASSGGKAYRNAWKRIRNRIGK